MTFVKEIRRYGLIVKLKISFPLIICCPNGISTNIFSDIFRSIISLKSYFSLKVTPFMLKSLILERNCRRIS